jgi:PEGA domain
MSFKIECTAVNELIDLVQHKPLARDSGEDFLFSAPREANLRRPAAGTQPPPMGTPRPIATDVPRQHPAAMRAELPAMVKKLALPAGIVLMVSIGVGAAISMSRHHAPEAKPVAIAAALPPPVIVTAPQQVALPAPPPHVAKLVEIRLESTPPGATATLLDTSNGNSTPLGTTPVDASVDPSKNYDVRFELAGRPSQTEHLDPARSRIDVALVDPAPLPAVATPAVQNAKHHRHHATAAKKAVTKRVATAPVVRTHAPAPNQVGAPTDVPGKVAVTTSVPCAILLDGTNTGMTTPATLSVAAGHHSIRLIAATQHINKQVGVDVTAKKTTRVNETF